MKATSRALNATKGSSVLRLQDTTAQIRVRGAFMLPVAFVALAALLGLETILGAFVAGVILRLIDGDQMMTHPQFRQKLEAICFGVFIPVFFRDERHTFRPGCALLKSFDYCARHDLPCGVNIRQGSAFFAVSSPRRRSTFDSSRTLASNIAFVHRCCIADRSGTRSDYEGHRRSLVNWAKLRPIFR